MNEASRLSAGCDAPDACVLKTISARLVMSLRLSRQTISAPLARIPLSASLLDSLFLIGWRFLEYLALFHALQAFAILRFKQHALTDLLSTWSLSFGPFQCCPTTA